MRTFEQNLLDSVYDCAMVVLKHLGAHRPFAFAGGAIVHVDVFFEVLAHLQRAVGELA